MIRRMVETFISLDFFKGLLPVVGLSPAGQQPVVLPPETLLTVVQVRRPV